MNSPGHPADWLIRCLHIEYCWGILEQHWNGTKLVDVETMVEWAKSMFWKGIHSIVKLSRRIYRKGISLSKKEMQVVAARLERNPLLPKWDILIRPVPIGKSFSRNGLT